MIDAAGLRVMRAIAENGSFTAAATSLGYTQPAISQMVRRLEHRVGTPLVERRGRTVALTQAGAVLAEHAVAVLDRLEQAETDLTALAGLRAGRVRVIAFPSSSATILPAALAVLAARHPAISVQLTEAEPTESLAALAAGQADLVVAFSYDEERCGDLDREGLVRQPLLDDELLLATPAGALPHTDCVDIASLRDAAWIAGCPQCRGHLVALTTTAGYSPRVNFETEDYVTVLGLVRAGLGVALVPSLVLRSIRTHGIDLHPLAQPSARQIEVITTPDLARVPAVNAMLEALCEAASAHPKA